MLQRVHKHTLDPHAALAAPLEQFAVDNGNRAADLGIGFSEANRVAPAEVYSPQVGRRAEVLVGEDGTLAVGGIGERLHRPLSVCERRHLIGADIQPVQVGVGAAGLVEQDALAVRGPGDVAHLALVLPVEAPCLM